MSRRPRRSQSPPIRKQEVEENAEAKGRRRATELQLLLMLNNGAPARRAQVNSTRMGTRVYNELRRLDPDETPENIAENFKEGVRAERTRPRAPLPMDPEEAAHRSAQEDYQDYIHEDANGGRHYWHARPVPKPPAATVQQIVDEAFNNQ